MFKDVREEDLARAINAALEILLWSHQLIFNDVREEDFERYKNAASPIFD